MNRIVGAVLMLFLGCGGEPTTEDAGNDAGEVVKHRYDCTLHAMCDLPDGGERAIDTGLADATCSLNSTAAEVIDAGAVCRLLTSPLFAFDPPLPSGTTCYSCAFTDCIEQQDVCQ